MGARPGEILASARLRPAIEEWLAARGDLTALGQRSGLGQRRIYAVLNEQAWVTVRVADALLCACEQSHLWYLPEEQGGFADVYFHPDVVGVAA
jgi:hypothetical protein